MTRRRSALHGMTWLCLATCLACGGVRPLPLTAQEIALGDLSSSPAKRQHVELLSAHAEAPAGRPGWVSLHFRVDPGFHINSHTPSDELLLATTLVVTGGEPVKVLAQEYPAGIPLRLEIGSGETLSTYQGEFALRLKVVAPPGDSTLHGVLRYQACDNHACFPPRSLPVDVSFVAR